MKTYADPNTPVGKLLALGEPLSDDWDDYSRFGFTNDHVPGLIRLGTDRGLLIEDYDVPPEYLWAPLHAWRALVQMKALDAVPALLPVFDWLYEEDGDLISEELTSSLIRFGPGALDSLLAVLQDASITSEPVLTAVSEVAAKIAVAHPQERNRAVRVIATELEKRYMGNDPEINGGWIGDLMDLKAVESYDVIKKAFDEDKVDIYVAGDLEEVEVEFGMRKKRSKPMPPDPRLLLSPLSSFSLDMNLKHEREKKKKEKEKRKQAKKARKCNHRK